MMRNLTETVSVWTEEHRPVRLVWRGQRFTVTDTPTPLGDTFAAPGMTHPLKVQWGWRFQGTNNRGDSFVFDVRHATDQTWELVAVYD